MAVKRMKKINLLIHHAHREEVFRLLQDMCVLEISEEEPVNKDLVTRTGVQVEDLERELSEVRFCLGFIRKYQEKKPSPLETFFPEKLEIDKEKFLGERFDYERVYKECSRMEEKINGIRNNLNRYQSYLDFLYRIEVADIALEDLKDTNSTKVFLFELLPEQLHTLQAELEKSGETWAIYDYPSQRKQHLVLAVIHRELEETLDAVLHEHSITGISLPKAFEGTPREAAERVQVKVDELEREREEYINQAATYKKFENDLKIFHDLVESHLQRCTNEGKILWTDATCLISGWSKAEDVPRIEKALSSRWKEWVLHERDPEPDEAVPIELENSSWVSNFRVLTSLYGMPHYSEIDPTPLVAVFFFLFFGICIGDVGYGVLMAIAGFVASSKLHTLADSTRTFFKMFAWCGVGAIIVGAFTGSWLGDAFEYLPPALGFLTAMREQLMLIDPLVNPLPMLIFTLGLGVFQVLVGMMVGFLKEWRRKKYTLAILDNLSWFFFVLSIIAYLAAMTIAPDYETLAMAFLIVMVLFLIATQGRHQKNPIMKVFSGVLSLYNLVNYLGDVLSYSRLFALGLATYIVAILARTLAELFSGSPLIGWLIAVFVFLLFHVFNIAMSGLSAFVHSARLHYVEFFTKFYESGGKEFKPLSYSDKYTKIT